MVNFALGVLHVFWRIFLFHYFCQFRNNYLSKHEKTTSGRLLVCTDYCGSIRIIHWISVSIRHVILSLKKESSVDFLPSLWSKLHILMLMAHEEDTGKARECGSIHFYAYWIFLLYCTTLHIVQLPFFAVRHFTSRTYFVIL